MSELIHCGGCGAMYAARRQVPCPLCCWDPRLPPPHSPPLPNAAPLDLAPPNWSDLRPPDPQEARRKSAERNAPRLRRLGLFVRVLAGMAMGAALAAYVGALVHDIPGRTFPMLAFIATAGVVFGTFVGWAMAVWIFLIEALFESGEAATESRRDPLSTFIGLGLLMASMSPIAFGPTLGPYAAVGLCPALVVGLSWFGDDLAS